jgi:hypothetical protein
METVAVTVETWTSIIVCARRMIKTVCVWAGGMDMDIETDTDIDIEVVIEMIVVGTREVEVAVVVVDIRDITVCIYLYLWRRSRRCILARYLKEDR